MSYSTSFQCYNCGKKDDCKDMEKIQAAVDAIHSSPCEEHLGGGHIAMQCFNQVEIKP